MTTIIIPSCPVCGGDIKLKNIPKYCSSSCYTTSRILGKPVKCSWCGKQIQRKPSRTAKLFHYFCCVEHYRLFRKAAYDIQCIRCGRKRQDLKIRTFYRGKFCSSCRNILKKVLWNEELVRLSDLRWFLRFKAGLGELPKNQIKLRRWKFFDTENGQKWLLGQKTGER